MQNSRTPSLSFPPQFGNFSNLSTLPYLLPYLTLPLLSTLPLYLTSRYLSPTLPYLNALITHDVP